jgi:hypothetical protein
MRPISFNAFEHIAQFMRQNYRPQEPSEVREDAKYMAEQVRKQAAGRPDWAAIARLQMPCISWTVDESGTLKRNSNI